MKSLCVITVLVSLLSSPSLTAKDIYKLITEGKIAEASELLSSTATASTRDGNHLFFRALIEPDAEQAAQLMERALESTIDHQYREMVQYRLAHYYLHNRNYTNLSRALNEYRSDYESGKYEQEMLRLSILADELSRDYESAQRQADRYSIRYNKGEADQWGHIDRARILIENKKRIGGIKLLQKLSRKRGGVGVPQSLYLLCSDAARRGRTEDAVFYYNMLKEAYPFAIGLESLTDQLATLSEGYHADEKAEKITGTYYSVKVGVFSIKANAKKQVKLFEGTEQQVDTGTKNISGKKYHVVYVGRFDSYEAAALYKRHLEQTHGEVFQVVAR